MALKLEDIMEGLIQVGIPLEERKKAMAEFERLEQEKKDDRDANKVPTCKKGFVVIMREGAEQAWVVQRKDGADNSTLVDTIKKIAKESNNAQKRKKNIVRLYREVFYSVKRTFWKSEDILVKTKEPCQVVLLPSESVDE